MADLSDEELERWEHNGVVGRMVAEIRRHRAARLSAFDRLDAENVRRLAAVVRGYYERNQSMPKHGTIDLLEAIDRLLAHDRPDGAP